MFREIVEATPDGVWLVDLRGRTLYANPAMARLLHRSVADLTAISYQEVLAEQDRRDFEERMATLGCVPGAVGEVEVELQRPGGSSLRVLASETLLAPDEQAGEPWRLLVRVADCDERRRMFQRETHALETLAEAESIAGHGSWVTDAETGVVQPSPGLRRVVDLPSGPLTPMDLIDRIHPDDRHIAASFAAADLGVRPFAWECRLRTREGYRWFAGRIAQRVGPDGRTVRQGTVVDIHERRVAESAMEDAFLQNVLLQSAAAAANEATSLLEGLRRSQQVILATGDWQRARAFVPDPDGGQPEPIHLTEEDRLADEADPETTAAERELAARCEAEGEILWEEKGWQGGPMVAFPISVPDEVVAIGVISSTTPIKRPEMIRAVLAHAGSQLARVAERDRAAERLAEARDAAMEASRQKSEFLATMSHEIRTPLNGVIGLNDLLLRTGLDPEQQRLATGIQVSSRALLGILNDVLDFSKIEAGHLVLEEMDFDVRGLLDQVAAVLGESARARGLELVVGCDPALPAVISGDPTRLAQVITNLGSNAVKFTESGSVTIRASLVGDSAQEDPARRARPGDGDDRRALRLRVEVTDTGVGIPAARRREIFDPFAQADASTTRRYGGTGLGLAICREIVSALGGEIGVEPREGGGSRFWFTATFRLAEGEGMSPEDRRAHDALAGRRVLVIDDSEHNRVILAEQVSWWGVECTTAATVDEALAVLRSAPDRRFDLVLLDLPSGDPDQPEGVAELAASPELDGAPLVLLSATRVSDATRLRHDGVATVLTKPVLASTLRSLLLRHLAPGESRYPNAPGGPGVAPANGEPADLDAEGLAEPGLDVDGAAAPERPRVLVAEDNPVNQMVASGLLDAFGYATDVVDDGDAALEAIQEGPEGRYGAVLMDLQMPRMDGYEATRELRRWEREQGDEAAHLPVIAMTASAIRGERERCLAAGMDDFVTKPVDPRALATVLARWLLGTPDVPPPEGPAQSAAAPAPELTLAPLRPVGPVDLNRLEMLRDLDDGGAYLARVIDRFEANHPTLLAELEAAIAAGDPEALRATAHAMKGTMTNIGLVTAGERAYELEALGHAGVVVGAEQPMAALRAAVHEGVAVLLGYRRSLGGGVGDRG